MKKPNTLGIIGLVLLLVLTATAYWVSTLDMAVLSPEGAIGVRQRDLMIFATLLMLVVVIPVFIMTFVFAWKFREGNKKAKYTPDWDHNKFLELTWWGIPFLIIFILSIVIWRTSHELDPYRPLTHNTKPITVQVVALQWKWLFLYPEQGIASVNFLEFPQNTPLNFEITSDAPMNSFWIPKLGGQVYAMSGMTTKLHLIANNTGDFEGVSANISGEGFAGMKFTARSTTRAEFDSWVAATKQNKTNLDDAEYNVLAQPSKNNQPAYYGQFTNGLYDKVVMKYMVPSDDHMKQGSAKNNETMHHHDTN